MDGKLTNKQKIVNHTGFFSGRLLAAMPGLQAGCFVKTVVFICRHDEAGAIGVVVNRPLPKLHYKDILRNNIPEIDTKNKLSLPIHFGGPIENERGFILHSADVLYKHSELFGNLAMSGSVDVVRDIVEGRGPQQHIFLLGYAGWGPKQLENEYQIDNSWMLLPCSSQLIFSDDNPIKWFNAFGLIGVDPTKLSGSLGHA